MKGLLFSPADPEALEIDLAAATEPLLSASHERLELCEAAPRLLTPPSAAPPLPSPPLHRRTPPHFT